MKTLEQTLSAGQTVTLPCNGSFFTLMEAAGPVDVHFVMEGRGAVGETCEGIKAGFWYEAPGRISKIILTSASAQNVKWGYSYGRAGYSTTTIQQSQASVTDNEDAVTLGTSAALALAGDATRSRLILTAHRDNAGAIALGGPALTTANAARWLEAGESYIETDAAPAAVYALAETAGDQLCIEVA